MKPERLLFASIHSYIDHSSGAALATRELLELLAAHGWDCRALSCGVLDYEQGKFVNPQLLKGAAVVARIAAELNRRRPEIPFLIVESRAGADELGRLPLDLSVLENLHRMANTPDPRDFYRVSRIVLVPSLTENAALVAREALANGIPVLASDRGGLPETLGDAGFVFALPERMFAPAGVGMSVPTAREVAPWVATIERLWDDPEFESKHRSLAKAAAQRWESDRLVNEYAAFFCSLDARRTVRSEGP
jgi:glycosyltransferase involved in cell wall biosynthesis